MCPQPEKFTFPKSVRLRRREDYQSMWKKGRKFYTPHFIFILFPSTHPSRLGVTVSRKVGNAVVRNRVKRQIKEVFRKLRPEMDTMDMSVVARSSAAQLTLKEMTSELTKQMLRYGQSKDRL